MRLLAVVSVAATAAAVSAGAIALEAPSTPVVATVSAPRTTASPESPESPEAPATTRTTEVVSRDVSTTVAAGLAVGVVRSARLREAAARPPRIVPAAKPFSLKPSALPRTGGPFSFVLGSFNVLGSQHSTRGGDKPNYPAASWRSAQAAGLMAKHGVDIVGTQELQDDQLRAITARTGMAAYPGFGWGVKETDNSILYDPRKFEFVSGSHFTITFVSRARPQPILRLRDKASGSEFYVINTHPSPGGGAALAQRRRAQATTVGVIRNLEASGLPVFITGDMNDRAEFFCHVAVPAGLVAANGGSTAGGCHPPGGPIAVDWVAGTEGVWTNYWRDTTPVSRKISDHFFISGRVSVG